MDNNRRIGLFLCLCGTHILESLDVDELTKYVKTIHNVAFCKSIPFACLSQGLIQVKETIREHKINRVVVAGCSPRTHEGIFRNACEEAGLNKFLIEMVNIRDQCSWVHTNKRVKATEKAKDLIRMGIAKVSLLEPYKEIEVEVNPTVLVIGGGISGMTAALCLANKGFSVKLVERESEIGGLVKNLYKIYPLFNSASEFVKEQIKAVQSSPNIQLFVNAKVTKITGYPGNYSITITRGDNHYEHTVGIIVVATGTKVFKPKGLFGYAKQSNVITQLELEEKLTLNSQLSALNSIVMIQCVGSRNDERPYCSRVCCMTAIKNAIAVKQTCPDSKVYIIFRDIQIHGTLHERDIVKAKELGVAFLRYTPARKPIVEDKKVSVYDELSGKEFDIPYDLLVLSTPLIPQDGAENLAKMLRIPIDKNKFFPEPYVKLRPEETPSNGIYFCGCAHWPSNISESMFQAYGAAHRALVPLCAGKIRSRVLPAIVNEDSCRGCGDCVEACDFNAIELIDKEMTGVEDWAPLTTKVARVIPIACRGCGACAVVCPSGAMIAEHFTTEQINSMIEAGIAKR